MSQIVPSIWFWSLAFLTMLFSLEGAYTRLSESGLSIMEWDPVLGIWPPFFDPVKMQSLFLAYQQTGEFLHEFSASGTVPDEEFYRIVFWEWLHRFLVRLIGFGLIGLALYLLISRRPEVKLARGWLWSFWGLASGLYLLQAFVGWYMVSSGFNLDLTDVAPVRLAIHLFLAECFIVVLVLAGWKAALPMPSRGLSLGRFKVFLASFSGLAALVLVLGALVSGLNAGKIYNEIPLMGSSLFPADYWLGDERGLRAFFANSVESPAAAQFHHRWLASLLLLGGLVLGYLGRRDLLSSGAKQALGILVLLLVLQFLAGILTLVFAVPILLALFHQALATLLFITLASLWYLT